MAFFQRADLLWHANEETAPQQLLRVPPRVSRRSPHLRPGIANILLRSSLLALGTTDSDGRLWTSLWAGEYGFSRSTGEYTMVIRASVDTQNDPAISALMMKDALALEDRSCNLGTSVSILGMDPTALKRVQIFGEVVFCALAVIEGVVGEVLLDIKVVHSSGLLLLPVVNIEFTHYI
jgi:hypothetical protein